MFTKRPDGRLVDDVPPYRRIMPYLMRGRNESAVYFEQHVDLTRTEAFVAQFNAAHADTKITLFHVVTWGIVRTLAEHPNLNRFVAGGRIYQRDGIWLSYSAKKVIAEGSPVVVLKRRFDPAQSFEAMVADMWAELRVGRSDEESTTDKELDVLLRLPGLGLRALLALGRFADAIGLLPRVFIENDPMFAGVFVANLGSLKMDAAFHHLYEYGNISIFCVIGRTHEEPVVVDGGVVPRRTAVLRFSYDERVEDGLYAQHALTDFQRLVEDPVAAGILGPGNGKVAPTFDARG